MSIMRCPTCGDAVYIGSAVKVGQIITCDSCEEMLKITSIQPIKLQICDQTLEDDDEFSSTPVRPSPTKKDKKNKVTSDLPGLKAEMEDFAEQTKPEKKKKKQIQRQKLEFFDE